MGVDWAGQDFGLVPAYLNCTKAGADMKCEIGWIHHFSHFSAINQRFIHGHLYLHKLYFTYRDPLLSCGNNSMYSTSADEFKSTKWQFRGSFHHFLVVVALFRCEFDFPISYPKPASSNRMLTFKGCFYGFITADDYYLNYRCWTILYIFNQITQFTVYRCARQPFASGPAHLLGTVNFAFG